MYFGTDIHGAQISYLNVNPLTFAVLYNEHYSFTEKLAVKIRFSMTDVDLLKMILVFTVWVCF